MDNLVRVVKANVKWQKLLLTLNHQITLHLAYVPKKSDKELWITLENLRVRGLVECAQIHSGEESGWIFSLTRRGYELCAKLGEDK